MPCTDPWADADHETKRQEEHAFLKAALCAVLRHIEDTEGDIKGLLAFLDYGEAGFTKNELRKWWRDHKTADARRRKKEADERKPTKGRRLKSPRGR